MMHKTNVESFDLDHTLVKAPYIRLAGEILSEHGDKVYKYDIRFCQPNQDHMEIKGLHSLEHLMADCIRNHLSDVIDISPMGCQTGFYLTVFKHNTIEVIATALEKTLNDVLVATQVPACNIKQCGWAANHSLSGAQAIARAMLSQKQGWLEVFK
jgi:S-ribosylhomocysteine lyase